MARTPEKEGHIAPSAPVTGAPPPAYPCRPRPLTMIAPAEALARVYAAAYTAERHTTNSHFDPVGEARDAARRAVRDFCALCTEEFEKPE